MVNTLVSHPTLENLFHRPLVLYLDTYDVDQCDNEHLLQQACDDPRVDEPKYSGHSVARAVFGHFQGAL